MIVLEASLELELKREKLVPILKSMAIALIGLVGSAYAAALILHQFIPGMDMQKALIYATPLSILSSAIIIPSVGGLSEEKKEFHVYESTFSDIMGIMMFYFLIAGINPSEDYALYRFYHQFSGNDSYRPHRQLCHHSNFSTYKKSGKVIPTNLRAFAFVCHW
ncbi:cation:proton antiporter [Maribacter litopenaei]|uniref:Cation:proton antiporter n=1 Tax=Maribacter litopenaei TaxID=2976127 RepID=A0ABY5YAM2_9FLAO|nr:cation:proton antiporter [Maribacter litopenaei]UWX55485.1 cation:proton antiporter [Maribacter litopenaei]